MKELYTTSGSVQKILKDSYINEGIKRNFFYVINKLHRQNLCLTTMPNLPTQKHWSGLSDYEFVDMLNKLPIPASKFIGNNRSDDIEENDFLPEGRDVFAYQHFNFINNEPHTQHYFEICYVYKGNCIIQFEHEVLTLQEGELFIVAPNSLHDFIVDNAESIVIGILIRQSTFEESFFHMLSQQDLLSGFFRNILYRRPTSNYLLFYTDNTDDIHSIIKNILMECYTEEKYFNNCSIAWISILFSYLLRNYSQTIRFYNYDSTNTKLPLILQYIQHNYKNLKLHSLAEYFHYSDAHMSTLIKHNTGMNFISLINKLKISKAVEYLENTEITISEIAEYVGFNSADHFSRTFKKHHDISPKQYRILHQNNSY